MSVLSAVRFRVLLPDLHGRLERDADAARARVERLNVLTEADVAADADADVAVAADDADVAVAAEVPVSADMALAVVLVTVGSGPLVGAWQLARVALAPRI